MNTFRRRRLELIEHELYWRGEITKSLIARAFDVSTKTIWDDIRRYAAEQENVRRLPDDRGNERWRALAGFVPKYASPKAGDLLYKLAQNYGISAPASFAQSLAAEDEAIPVYAVPELARRSIDPEHLRRIAAAIRQNTSSRRKPKKAGLNLELKIVYSSPSRSSKRTFWIWPHALSHDSFRWAVRAYREDDGRFGDLVLDRISAIRGERENVQAPPSRDTDWEELEVILLQPNPALSPLARTHIERQYGMRNGILRVPVRRAFVVYFLKRYQLEEESLLKRPHQQPLVVKNRNEVTSWIPEDMRIATEPDTPRRAPRRRAQPKQGRVR